MQEYKRVLETNIFNAELSVDEDTLFNPDIITNYVDNEGNHYLVCDMISVVIPKSEWDIFLQNIRTIHYEKKINIKGSKIEKIKKIEKLDAINFNRSMLYQMGYKHHINEFADHRKKFLDVRHLQSKMKWGMLLNNQTQNNT